MLKKVKVFIFVFSLIVFSVGANFVLAQADFGTEPVAEVINLSQADPRAIAGRIIQITLSFLGVIALLLVIYAGFLWTTSGGDEDKITKAKKILKNAVIGLIIILSSWSIATFILSKLSEATGVKEGSNQGGIGRISLTTNSGLSAIGACSVDTVYPENKQTDVARNSAITITFKEPLKAESVCVDASGSACACNNNDCSNMNPESIRIFKTELGDSCNNSCPKVNANITEVKVSISSDSRTLVLTPLSYLGDGVNNVWYSVKMTDKVKKIDDTSMFKNCYDNYFNWRFEVSSRIDLTPPQVVVGGIFPLPDNENDVSNKTAEAKKAEGSITVKAMPKVYQAAKVEKITSIGESPVAVAAPLNYQGTLTQFKAVISADTSKVQLFDGNNDTNLLGSASFDAQNTAKFAGYFTLTADNRSAGNAWLIEMSPEQLADTLTLGSDTYTFSSTNSGANIIKINPEGDFSEQVRSIYAILSGNSSFDVSNTGDAKISLVSKVAGASGNKIEVSTSNPSALQITPPAGGQDRQSLDEVRDRKDVPMNTVIQLNFDEPVNPIKIAGLASEVADYIKVVNYKADSFADGLPCVADSDCQSYKCEGAVGAKTCVGDYVAGRFIVSNAYRTVEFISDKECGVNGCGEKIYCLPGGSHLAVKMKTADLKTCSTNADCTAYSPYNICSPTSLGYNTCQDIDGNNYPSASAQINGVVDLALNSFDGDRNNVSDGPLNFYNDNFSAEDNHNKKDNYRFSFFVNNTINLTPPKIESITPVQGATGVGLAEPIKIAWNTLMMNSTLTTGSRKVNNGLTTVEHKLINLWSSANQAVGYWVKNENIDIETPFQSLDGEPDKTISWIMHTPLLESMTYHVQAGSGIRDIYQNCYKPSASESCVATETSPSCCFGTATNVLGVDGNCQ
ncbi:Ig-like domain-containing protein [Candidatus Falkowbacteria bacterium]|jgi:hypothetical protein|nr:Ig-like domain-containing protein [Candidatus Falkowbacteria bacterium]